MIACGEGEFCQLWLHADRADIGEQHRGAMPFSGAGITLQPESWPEGAKALAPMSKPSLHSCNSGDVNGPPFERDFQGPCRAIGMSQERTVKQDVRVSCSNNRTITIYTAASAMITSIRV